MISWGSLHMCKQCAQTQIMDCSMSVESFSACLFESFILLCALLCPNRASLMNLDLTLLLIVGHFFPSQFCVAWK